MTAPEPDTPGPSPPDDWPTSLRQRLQGELNALDRAISSAVASTPTPTLDEPMTWLSNAANNSKLWLATSVALSALGPNGRRASAHGLIAVGLTSITANLAAKRLFPRYRPERPVANGRRDVRMPTSSSFPSGHTASAFAFATVISVELPQFSFPLYGLASAVGWSRVHTGVHFPSDVWAGALLGSAIGSAVLRVTRRRPG